MLDKLANLIGESTVTITLNSTEAQQNFGAVIGQAYSKTDVIVERYGTPRAVIVNYQRYQALVDAARTLLRLRLQRAAEAATARAAGHSDAEIDRLIEEAREEASVTSRR